MNTIIGISGLVIALLTIDCLVQHPDDVKWLRSRFTAVWGILSDKDRGLPVFVLGLLIWLVILKIRGDI